MSLAIKDIDMFEIIYKDTTFISCTSEDKEFLSLLERIGEETKRLYFEPMSDIACLSNKGAKISIVKSGFPINFDKSPYSVPSKDIELTRALLLGACIQAILTASRPIDDGFTINQLNRHMLNPHIQQWVLRDWLKYQPLQRYPQELLNYFNNLEWVIANSGGDYYPNSILSKGFSIEREKNESYVTPTPTKI